MALLVKFKSDKKFFYKERDGRKNNTVRFIDVTDIRFKKLLGLSSVDFEIGDIDIRISNKDDPREFFIRHIKDISVYNTIIIITWCG